MSDKLVNEPYKAPRRWRKSISLPDGVEKSVCVKEIENGFIIEMYKSWTDKEGNYKSEERTLYSPTNPLKEMEPEIEVKDINNFLNPPIQLM